MGIPDINWMIYGANGFSGRLIAEEAGRRGWKPVIAGRNEQQVKALAENLGLDYRVFALEQKEKLIENLRDIHTILNCAGPFIFTAEPVIQACLQTVTNYLDITGELGVFKKAIGYSSAAKEEGIVLCPGVGFDVIATDCVAAKLKSSMPDAVELNLGIQGNMSVTAGTAKSMLELLKSGTFVRREGRLTKTARRHHVRQIDFGDGVLRMAAVVPWADLCSAFVTTQIPNINFYLPVRGGKLELWLDPVVTRLLQKKIIRHWLGKLIDRKMTGPSEEERQSVRALVWGEVHNLKGDRRVAHMTASHGYALVVTGSLAVVEFLSKYNGGGGYFTPSLLMGSNMVDGLPGCSPITVHS